MSDNLSEDELHHIRDLPLTSEAPAYPAEAMITCGGCSRANPPNRLNCIYCGRDLDRVDADSEAMNLTLRAAEEWEPGHNVILLPANGIDIAAASEVLRLDRPTMEEVVNSGTPLPVLRLASRSEAEIIGRRMAECEMQVHVMSDDTLDAGNLPRRLRRIEFTNESHLELITFNGGERIKHLTNDIALIVTGTIRKNETETRAKRKKGSFKTIDETSTSSDVSVIDLYAHGDARGYRVVTNGFDFSSLGEEMTAVAASNVKLLAVKLANSCRSVRLIDSYDQVRRLLEATWPAGRSRNFLGVQRGASVSSGFSSVETSDNVVQFTKFSRMHFHLL